MTSLTILYDVDGWAYHHDAGNLKKYAPPDFNVSISVYETDINNKPVLGETPPDIILLLPYTRAPALRAALDERGWSTKLAIVYSTGWPEKFETFHRCYQSCDLVIVNNLHAWNLIGALERATPIANGVDLDAFRVTRPITGRRPRVIWTGSEMHRRLKGYDSVLRPLEKKLRSRGIDHEFLLVDSFGNKKRSHQEMVQWYNDATVYVCASRTEGTPNTALEAAACGCTIVTTRVGNMPELVRNGVNGYQVERSPEAILAGIEAAINDYQRLAEQMQQDIRHWDWKASAASYFNVLRHRFCTTDQQVNNREYRADLSSEVTVFVTTVGSSSYEACRMYLDQQDCVFRLEIIENVAPMSAAFQIMLDRCKTPYYVQVDEDMLLFPHAIRSLYREICAQPKNVALFVAQLHDVHLGEEIDGVKIFRHQIVKNYPFRDTEGCEVDQIHRFGKDGYRYARIDRGLGFERSVIGLHDPCRTPFSVYERYLTLERRRRNDKGNLDWVEEKFPVVLRRFHEEPNEKNFFAMMGFVAGSILGSRCDDGEKDYRAYKDFGGFQELREYWKSLQRHAAAGHYPIKFPVGLGTLRHGTGQTRGELQVCHPGHDREGHCVYGPHLNIVSDQYLCAVFQLQARITTTEHIPVATLDVYDNSSDSILAIRTIDIGLIDGNEQLFLLPFQTRRGQVLEFRVYWHGHHELSVRSVNVDRPAQ